MNDNENNKLKQKMQLLVTEVRKSWESSLLRLTQNDREFVSRFLVADAPVATTTATAHTPPLMTLEDRIRSFPPRSEIGGYIRSWFEGILSEKSQMLTAANRERLKCFNQFRLQLLPLHDEVLQKMTSIFQKYKPIVAATLAPGGVSGTTAREIQAFFAQKQPMLAEISSQWIIPDSSVTALLKFVLLTRDELLNWEATPAVNIPPANPAVNVPPRVTSARVSDASQYMQLLHAQQQARDQLYRDRQQQVNQMKDAAAQQNREKKQLFRKWATDAPFPGWIAQLEQLLAQESDVSILEWQNTTLRMRKIAADLQQLLLVDAEKQLQGMLRAICGVHLAGTLQRLEQQFLQKTRSVLQNIQQLARSLPEAEFHELREWMSIREQIFHARVATASANYPTTPPAPLSSASVWTPAPRQTK